MSSESLQTKKAGIFKRAANSVKFGSLVQKAAAAKHATAAGAGAVAGGLGDASTHAEDMVRSLRKRAENACGSLQESMELALRSDDSERVGQLLDLALASDMASTAANIPAVRRAAECQARKQLLEAIESGDARRLKGALVAARRLDAVSLTEFERASEVYKKLTRLPATWDLQQMVLERRRPGRLIAFHDLSDDAILTLFQWLFDSTHRRIWTRDRKEEQVPSRFQVVSVDEVMNDKLWIEYSARREIVREELEQLEHEEPGTFQQMHFDTDNALSSADRRSIPSFEVVVPNGVAPGTEMQVDNPFSEGKVRMIVPADLGANHTVTVTVPFAAALPGPPLAANVNEKIMFHGTSPIASETIATTNFQTKMAGSSTGTLYGRGIYASDNCTKGDEYAAADKDGIHTMLVCRAVLGRIHYTAEVKPDPRQCEELCMSGVFHSVLGDRRKCRGTFREFVVFDDAQVYPHYIVKYVRICK